MDNYQTLTKAMQLTIATGLSCLFAMQFAYWCQLNSPMISEIWACTSAIVVFRVNITEAHPVILNRLLGTFIGGICAACFVWLFHASFFTILCVVFVITLLISCLEKEPVLRISVLTGVIIVITDMIDVSAGPWKNALARVIESIIGITVTYIVIWASQYVQKKA